MAEQHYSRWWEGLFFFSQIIMIIFFCVGTELNNFEYNQTHNTTQYEELNYEAAEETRQYYPMWMDIHVMIFVGFGFIMVFLKTNGWASIGFNYCVAAWAIQCGIVF